VLAATPAALAEHYTKLPHLPRYRHVVADLLEIAPASALRRSAVAIMTRKGHEAGNG
jgi:hypothetical protein